MAFARAKGVTPDRAERMAKVLEMKRAGWYYYEIAEKLGISTTQACQDYKESIAEITKPIATEIVEEHRARIAGITKGLYPKARRGDSKAADSLTKLMVYEARLLALFPKEKSGGVSVSEAQKYVEFILKGGNDTDDSAAGGESEEGS